MKSLLTLSALLISSIAWGEKLLCPESIETAQTLRSALPKGWTSAVDSLNGKHPLENVQVFDGPFDDGASLVPDNEGKEETPHWILSKDAPRPFLMACFYSQSVVRVLHELPKDAKKCTTLFKTKPYRVLGLSCE
jgi:hypothetical protein